jgi:hypothetical protein
MPRELSNRDLDLLKKLAPECTEIVCSGSGFAFRSILPPVANHFAVDAADFRSRLDRLTPDDLMYLVTLIRDGSESMGCVPPEYGGVFIDTVSAKLDTRTAAEMMEIYENSQQCED